jgi:SAM domain (Sterile alpha motif)
MQQIADWLEKLGMSEYAERFAESDIDIDLLSELTDHDFDRLGVSLGHRRKMLRAIRELSARQSRLPRSAKHLRRSFQNRPQRILPSVAT